MAVSVTRPKRKDIARSSPEINERFPVNGYYFAAIIAAIVVCCVDLYSPAIRGPFVFDDLGLPFAQAHVADESPTFWLSGVRPVLMLSYWLNFNWSGTATFSYHFLNLVIHCANACLAFLILWKVMAGAAMERRKRLLLALFGMAVFLVHPLQTESVSYIAGRSESLGALFFLAAWCVFLYRGRRAISWLLAGVVLVLFALASASKENMVVLPALLVLSDCFWNRPFSLQGIRENWRLYVPIAAAAAAACIAVWHILATAKSAGFALKELTPVTYFLTETRAIFGYIWMFVFPTGQSLDHEFAVSHTLLGHGAIVTLLLLIGLVAAAIVFRKKYPLSSFGFLAFLLLLAPTSSFAPLADPFVERRMYLPLIGLLLIACDMLSRLNLRSVPVLAAMSCVVIALSMVTYHRNVLWADPFSLLKDAVEHSPGKGRPYELLAKAAVQEGRCRDVVPYLQQADHYSPNDPYLLVAWSTAMECLGQLDPAMLKLQKAAEVAPSSFVYELQGLLYGEMGRMDEAKAALDKATITSPPTSSAYVSRGQWYEATRNYEAAIQDYRKALEMNSFNFGARIRLAQAERLLRGS